MKGELLLFLVVIIATKTLASQQYGQSYGEPPRQHIKLHFGIHVPPIVLRLPRLNMPQVTIKANFMKQPYAKPLELNLPPPPQLSFGNADYGNGGGGYGGGGNDYGGGGGGGGYGGGGGEGYGGGGGDYGGGKPNVNIHKTVKVSQAEDGYKSGYSSGGGGSGYGGGGYGTAGHGYDDYANQQGGGSYGQQYSSRSGHVAPGGFTSTTSNRNHYPYRTYNNYNKPLYQSAYYRDKSS